MKFSVERSTLLKSLSHVQSIVERRHTVPILANVRLDAEENALRLTATDYDIEVIETVDAKIGQSGAVTVNASLLHDIVRKLPDGSEVQFAYEGERAHIEVGRAQFDLATLPAEDFPRMASPDFEHHFEMNSGDLVRLFNKTRFAISTEETRYYLNGIYLHTAEEDGEKALRAVATDGHRLARIDQPCPIGAENMPGVIVPRKTVGEISKMFEDEKSIAQVAVSEAKIRFTAERLVLTSKVVDGTFPDYTRVIPQGNDKKLVMDAKGFATAVDRVATMAERTRAVKMSLEEDQLTLSVESPDAGRAEEELGVAYAENPMEIGFNAKYLLEIAGQMEQKNAVFFLNDSNSPTLVQEGDDTSAVYVVMPMRV